ncbi:hypothetical protein [Mucilaginibacter pedocola]|uniref:Uncharacterized protein n=1 Tax=Mucilaginibacter pedocola TaxID=1792845 RepID=A0A1S9PMP1_9SPHI|nr:hypothetical protein [Mucilaginibacter pedocola]OOQ62199.1 hypothetical protein BC343_03920 [Mucilaginibacter pedocola]
MEQQPNQINLEKALIVGGLAWFVIKAIGSLNEPDNTVNYKLYYKRKLVYHGITFEYRLDERLCEHERNGLKFDYCEYDDAKQRSLASEIERKRIRRDCPKHNKQHNRFAYR